MVAGEAAQNIWKWLVVPTPAHQLHRGDEESCLYEGAEGLVHELTQMLAVIGGEQGVEVGMEVPLLVQALLLCVCLCGVWVCAVMRVSMSSKHRRGVLWKRLTTPGVISDGQCCTCSPHIEALLWSRFWPACAPCRAPLQTAGWVQT